VHVGDLAEDDPAAGVLDRALEPALEGRGRLADPARPDGHALAPGQTGRPDLVDLGRELDRADDHLPDDRLVDEVG
jgi:hypothetical protein